MKYLIVQDWPNTHNNHAGMVHMCNLLKQTFPNEYTVLVQKSPRYLNFRQRTLNVKFRQFYEKYIFPWLVIRLCKKTFPLIKEGDEFFLLEYLFPETSQLSLAKLLRKKFPFLKIYGMSHLTPTYGENKYPSYRQMVHEWLLPINKYLTLGSSLTDYFVSLGVSPNCVSTGFHYVDGTFYTRTNKVDNERLKIIVIGAMARNFELLEKIVKASPMVDWIICKGNKHVTCFDGCNNVQLHGFLEEEELRRQMAMVDVSLSVMDDTIGSNVITTSMSMGLAQIVSDVGSVRDYCSEQNTIFCENNLESFVDAVKILADDRNLVKRMGDSASVCSKKFDIKNVHQWFSNL